MEPPPIGLVAGWGSLPVRIAQKAHAAGIPVICLGFRGLADRAALEPYCKRFYWSRLGQLNRPIRLLRREGVRQWAVAGKIHKVELFKRFRWVTLLPDLRMIRFWLRRRSNIDIPFLRVKM